MFRKLSFLFFVLISIYPLQAAEEVVQQIEKMVVPAAVDNQSQFHDYMDQDDDRFYEINAIFGHDKNTNYYRRSFTSPMILSHGMPSKEGPLVEFKQTYFPYALRIEDNATFKNRYEEYTQKQFKKKLRFVFSNEFPLTLYSSYLKIRLDVWVENFYTSLVVFVSTLFIFLCRRTN